MTTTADNSEEIAQQQQLLAIHRRTLAHYLHQHKALGVIAPPGVTNGIHECWANIERIKGTLRANGIDVADEPDDEPRELTITVPTLSAQERRNRRAMLEKVKTIWIEGLLEHSLAEVVKIDLGLVDKPDAVELPLNLQYQELNRQPRPIASGTPIIDVFTELGSAMLILGSPGAGKTTLLLELARDLIACAERDEGHPVPVVFNLSSWFPNRRPLREWLIEELNTKYDVPRKLAQAWTDADSILPLLDGLDEVPSSERTACVVAINAYRQEYGLAPIAVCSRQADYEALDQRLTLAGAVLIQPLSDQQITTYFDQSNDQLAPLRVAVGQDTVLQELAKTPLMLNVMAVVYGDQQHTLQDTTVDASERRQQLWDGYISAMFQRRQLVAGHTRESTIIGLEWLAHGMQRHYQAVLYVGMIRPDWIEARRQRWFATGGLAVLGTIAGVVIGWLVIGNLLGVLLGGLVGMIASGLSRYDSPTPDFRRPPPPAWAEAGYQRSYGLSRGVAAMPAASARISGVLADIIVDLLRELLDVLLGFVDRFLSHTIPTAPGFSRRTYWSMQHIILVGVFGGLLGGLLGGLIGGLNGALWGAIILGLLGGSYYGGCEIVRYIALRLVLWRYGILPLHLVRFLDSCVDRIFMWRVGEGYVFVHRLLMEHFASSYDAPIKKRRAR